MIYRATHVTLDLPRAVKLITPQFARDRRYLERFRIEATAAARIEHPNVVAVHDFGEVDGSPYLVMQYVEGVDLERLVEREGPLAPRRALALLAQIADGLDAAHAMGVVHRDVKPGNILVVGEPGSERALLTDFGLRQAAHRGAPTGRASCSAGRWSTPRPSRWRARRSTRAPTCTRWPASCSSCSPAGRRGSATCGAQSEDDADPARGRGGHRPRALARPRARATRARGVRPRGVRGGREDRRRARAPATTSSRTRARDRRSRRRSARTRRAVASRAAGETRLRPRPVRPLRRRTSRARARPVAALAAVVDRARPRCCCSRSPGGAGALVASGGVRSRADADRHADAHPDAEPGADRDADPHAAPTETPTPEPTETPATRARRAGRRAPPCSATGG